MDMPGFMMQEEPGCFTCASLPDQDREGLQ
jgi:hypothetical protein